MMAKKKPHTPLKATQDANAKTLDSFVNYVAKLGLGSDPLLSSTNYALDFSTRNRIFLESAYRSSWIVQAVVGVVAEDMTREGVSIECGKLKPKDHMVLDAVMEDLEIWEKLAEGIRWSRLFGTSAIIPLIDGQILETPLDFDTIGENQFKGIAISDRWRLLPSIGEPITDYGPLMGLPKFYKTTSDLIGIADQIIHYSRAWRIDCVELPYYQKLSESMFSESIVEVIRDRLVAFDSATMGAASLVFKAHLRTMKVQGLREIMAGNQDAQRGLAQSLDQMRAWQSNNGLSVIDSADELQIDSYSFSGLGDILERFMEQISGATGIPVVRLFGTSPSGLNSDGASGLNTYYDLVRRLQERQLRKPLRRIYDLICRSYLGRPLPEDFKITFRPLWQNSDSGKSDIAAKTLDAISKAYEAGLISQHQALRELKQTSNVNGLFTTLSEKEISEAETEVPSFDELMSMNAPAPNASASNGASSNGKEKDKEKGTNGSKKPEETKASKETKPDPGQKAAKSKPEDTKKRTKDGQTWSVEDADEEETYYA